MNQQFRKSVIKLIREHFEQKFKMTYEQKKDMYSMIAIFDEVFDKIDVIEIISEQDVRRVKVMNELVGELFDHNPKDLIGKTNIYPFKQNGILFNMVVIFKWPHVVKQSLRIRVVNWIKNLWS